MGTGGSVDDDNGATRCNNNGGGDGVSRGVAPTSGTTPSSTGSGGSNSRQKVQQQQLAKASSKERRKELGLEDDEVRGESDRRRGSKNSNNNLSPATPPPPIAKQTSASSTSGCQDESLRSPASQGVSPSDAAGGTPSGKKQKKTKIVTKKKIIRKVVSKNGETITQTVIKTTTRDTDNGKTLILSKGDRENETTTTLSGGEGHPSDKNNNLASNPNTRNVPLFQGSEVRGWSKGPQIGKGATGAVYVATEHSTNSCFCVKEIEFSENFVNNPQDRQRFDQLKAEIALLKEVQHPNVVKFIGVDKIEFSMYIMMELVAGGNIAEIIKQFGALSDSKACQYTKQIAEGLAYLHDKNVIHRDIKGANILVSVDGSVKLADFGAAKRTMDPDQLFKTLAGTPYWMAPEVVRQEGHNKPADVWSLGATVLQMISGLAPYQSLAPVPALFRIGHGKEKPIPDELKASPLVVDFISKCLHRDASKRPSVKELLNHPWLVSYGNRKASIPAAPTLLNAEDNNSGPTNSTTCNETDTSSATASTVGSSDPTMDKQKVKEEQGKERVSQTPGAAARRQMLLEEDLSLEEDEIREFIIHKCFAQAIEDDEAYFQHGQQQQSSGGDAVSQGGNTEGGKTAEGGAEDEADFLDEKEFEEMLNDLQEDEEDQ